MGTRTEALVWRMLFLVVFSTGGSPAGVKIVLLVCAGFPRNLRLTFLKFVVTISSRFRNRFDICGSPLNCQIISNKKK